MKKIFTSVFILFISVFVVAQTDVDVVTGASYKNDVYYSFEEDSVKGTNRYSWDIAFTTNKFSANILANNGVGVELYTYPNGDISSWDNVDTTGMVWTPMFNSNTTWEDGAFLQNATGGFDFGWGTYSTSNHHITGDSLFIVKTRNLQYKKLWLIEKNAPQNEWSLKFANLDGSDEKEVLVKTGGFITKNFLGYDLENATEVDMEPASADWDLLFTKYFDTSIPYFVSGVLSNEAHVTTQEIRQSGLDRVSFSDFGKNGFIPVINNIGSDWKQYDFASHTYSLVDTVVYFVKVEKETGVKYWKLYFTGFEGSSTGKYSLVKEQVFPTSVNNEHINVANVYPNPAKDNITLVYDFTGDANINIYDRLGRNVYSESNIRGGFSNHKIDISNLNKGIYILEATIGSEVVISKFIVN